MRVCERTCLLSLSIPIQQTTSVVAFFSAQNRKFTSSKISTNKVEGNSHQSQPAVQVCWPDVKWSLKQKKEKTTLVWLPLYLHSSSNAWSVKPKHCKTSIAPATKADWKQKGGSRGWTKACKPALLRDRRHCNNSYDSCVSTLLCFPAKQTMAQKIFLRQFTRANTFSQMVNFLCVSMTEEPTRSAWSVVELTLQFLHSHLSFISLLCRPF